MASGGESPRAGFSALGLSGPGTGAWTRFEQSLEAVHSNGCHVFVLESGDSPLLATGSKVEEVARVPLGSAIDRFVRSKRILQSFVSKFGLQVLHVEAAPFVAPRGVKTLATIHDLRFHTDRAETWFSSRGAYYRGCLKRHLSRVSGVVVPSQWTAVHVQRLLGVDRSKVFVVPNIVVAPDRCEIQACRVGERNRFALALGSLEPRKNLEVLVEAASLSSWPRDLRLVIAGRDLGVRAPLEARARNLRAPVDFLGPVTEECKWSLLVSAEVVLVPSLHEGFGIPAIEAPAVGTPVLVSDRTALPELAGHKRATVPAEQPSEWASRVSTIVSCSDFRQEVLVTQQRSLARFSPTRIAEDWMSIYDLLGVSTRK